MRIAKNTQLVITEAPTLRFLLVIDVMDGDVLLQKAGSPLIHIRLVGEDVHATLSYPDGREKTLIGANARGKEVILTAGYARMGLYTAGVLLDEDFFLAPIDYRDATVTAGSFMHFEAGYEYHSADESAIVEGVTDQLDGFRPVGRGRTVTRVIPAAIGDRLHLFYLDGRSYPRAEKDKNAHKLSAMFSDDGEVFHGAPIALGIDNVREWDITDAALIEREGRYYLYYTVVYESHRTLSCAVSEDGFSFMKTGLDVQIPGIDSAAVTSVSVLDGDIPCLYFVADGRAYYAESIDLLHFGAPVTIDLPSVDKVIPLPDGTLYAQKGEKLYRATAGRFAGMEAAPSYAHPVLYREALWLFGSLNGAFSCQKA